jgi:hypothetical protein
MSYVFRKEILCELIDNVRLRFIDNIFTSMRNLFMPEHQQTQQSKNQKTFPQRQLTSISHTLVSNPDSIIQRARIDPKSLTSAEVLQLQRTIGNRAVGRLLSEIRNTSKVQQVPVQRQEMPEEKEPLQGKFESKPERTTCLSCSEVPIIQRQEIPEEKGHLQRKMIETIQSQEVPEEEEHLQMKKENNTGMPNNLKYGVESLSGIDMSDVRVHYNSSKPAGIGALAYTQGTNIHIAPGREKHLPHETWHVVQQVQGRVKPTMQMREGIAVNDDKELEREADIMGYKALQMYIQSEKREDKISRYVSSFHLNSDNNPSSIRRREEHEGQRSNVVQCLCITKNAEVKTDAETLFRHRRNEGDATNGAHNYAFNVNTGVYMKSASNGHAEIRLLTLEKGDKDVEIVSELTPCVPCQRDMSLFERVHSVNVTVYYNTQYQDSGNGNIESILEHYKELGYIKVPRNRVTYITKKGRDV